MEKIKIYFDPEKKYFRAFLHGEEVSALLGVCVNDNWEPGEKSSVTATFSAIVDVVNSDPTKEPHK